MKARALAQRVLCVVAVLAVSLGAVQAKTIYVDDDGTADYRTLQAAMAAAKSGETIVVAPGNYSGTEARDLVLAGKVLTIQSSDPDDPNVVAATVIDCQAKDGFGHRFIEITANTGVELTLAGLTVVNGSGAFSGGVVLCKNARLELTNCTFVNNDAEWRGGVVDCNDSEAIIEGCTFTGNTASGMHGGAVFARGTTLSISDSTFEENTGSALEFFDSVVTVTDCTFENNSADEGGAVYAYVTSDVITQTGLRLAGCTFVKNVATTYGGALCSYGTRATIDACTFTANAASDNGGAIYNHRSSPTITNCVFDENIANDFGGAVANNNNSAPEILHCTFVANVADSGGAVSSRRQSAPLLSHCIFWSNEADQGSSICVARETTGITYVSKATIKYCDVQKGKASTYTETGCTLTWGSGNLEANPLFSGPESGDYHLAIDSPCVDAGDPDYFAAVNPTDRDGAARPYGKIVDLGAYEYQGLAALYRFWSPGERSHFYTISGTERNDLLDHYPHTWVYEGIAYYVFPESSETGLVPAYRFWAPSLEAYFWTTSETERIEYTGDSNVWTYEGVDFYVYDASKAPEGTVPVYRFWSNRLHHHFYTMSVLERDHVIATYRKVWTYEGVAFHAYGTPYVP